MIASTSRRRRGPARLTQRDPSPHRATRPCAPPWTRSFASPAPPRSRSEQQIPAHSAGDDTAASYSTWIPARWPRAGCAKRLGTSHPRVACPPVISASQRARRLRRRFRPTRNAIERGLPLDRNRNRQTVTGYEASGRVLAGHPRSSLLALSSPNPVIFGAPNARPAVLRSSRFRPSAPLQHWPQGYLAEGILNMKPRSLTQRPDIRKVRPSRRL